MLELEISRKELLDSIPTTRYQGSKRKILPWIYNNLKELHFETVLDGFGGTVSVSYLFKLMGKRVTYNDILRSNFQSGIALIENSEMSLNSKDIDFILNYNDFDYPTFIQETFRDIYYLDIENKWLDIVSFNIQMLAEFYKGKALKTKKSLAYHALFQACLIKRPFNLFHRKNLNLRTNKVERKFGNKKTWEKKFPALFKQFADELSAKVFSNEKKNKAICKDVLKINKNNFDLVYLDPPYTRPKDRTTKNYFELYHFLEGLVDYDNWAKRVNLSQKNRGLKPWKNNWIKTLLLENFENLIKQFKDSIIVISYGSPGYPSIKDIEEILRSYKSSVTVREVAYTYKLNRGNGTDLKEVLIIGK